MLILGCDPASIKAGYGIIRAEGEHLAYVDAGVISAPAGWDRFRRLAEIGREFEALFSEHAIDALAIESGFVKNLKGALTLGESRAIPAYIASRRGVAVFEYAPSTVKLHVAGHGRAEKDQVANQVRILLGMQRQPEPDAGDALAVAVTHARHLAATRRLRAA